MLNNPREVTTSKGRMIGFDVTPDDAFKDCHDRALKAINDLRQVDGDSIAMSVLNSAIRSVYNSDPHNLDTITDTIYTAMRDAQDKKKFNPKGDDTWAKRDGKWMYVGD